MIRIIVYLFCFIFLLSCVDNKSNSEETKKDVYLKENLSKVLNLSKSEVDVFKETMFFEPNGALSSWNIELLEKAYNTEEEFTGVFAFLVSELGKKTDTMRIVNSDNSERTLIPKILSLEDKTYSLDQIKQENAVFYITSTNCGSCTSEYKNMNLLASKFKNKGIKFIAVFDKIENINNYKKGYVYKENGFVDNNWTILGMNSLLPVLTKKYKSELGFPFVFFRKNNSDLGIYPNAHDYESISKVIEDNF